MQTIIKYLNYILLVPVLIFSSCQGQEFLNLPVVDVPVGKSTYYVAITGSDSNSGSTKSKAWKTISYALTQVSSGDIVLIGDGIYESGQLFVPPGVSLTSISHDNAKVILQPNTNLGINNTPFISLVSGTPGSDGNQSISYITINGRTETNSAYLGIEVRNRNKVSIHNCVIQNFHGIQDSDWNFYRGLKVWSSQVMHTSNDTYYKSLVNNDMSKSSNYPVNPVTDFHFYDNKVIKCGGGLSTGERKFSQAIWPWHLYNSSFHDNYIDVSHTPTQAITGTSALLEKVDIYNNIIVGHKVGGFPNSTTSGSLYLIELWVLHDCKFYNNKLINGSFSTTYGKDIEWYNNYVDRSTATWAGGIGIEATQVNQANLHHNKIVGNPDVGNNMGMTIGVGKYGKEIFTVYVWNNIFHGNRAHTIHLTSGALYNVAKVNAYIFNNIIDFTGLSGGYSGIDISQFAPSIMEDVIIRNNIISNNRGVDVRVKGTMGNLQVDHNILFNNGSTGISQFSSSNLKVEPLFSDYNNDNFEIKSADAPQIDSGVNLDIQFDQGFSKHTYWGTSTSKDLPKVVLKGQTNNAPWEIGPYIYLP